jgi:hypothetical protein
MGRTAHLLVGAAVAVVLHVSPARAQAPAPATTPPATGAQASAEFNPLSGLPRPPDQPASLFVPPAPPGPPPPPLPGPYFQPDARLDPPDLPPPGWFTGLDVGIVGPHVKNRLDGMVLLPGARAPDDVHVPGADLNWTVSPEVELGYRLMSGFGEFVVSYRSLASDGSNSAAPAGVAALSSRLNMNQADFDYASREFCLLNWPYCYLKFRFGLRLTTVYFDAVAQQPPGVPATGTDEFARRSTDRYWGLGPHGGLELERRLEAWGLSLVGATDGAILLGRIRQGFFEEAVGPGGELLAGQNHVASSQAVPMLSARLGLGWQPPGWQDVCFFAGYQYEYYWNVGRFSKSPTSRGELSDQGVLLRAEFSF